MGRRIMLGIIGGGMGALVGLLVDFLGGGNPALVICAILGAVVPQFILGEPGPHNPRLP
jgi:hypothetical protein